jgi:predicted SprT family Zn-dependent metalloprotease
MRDLQEYAIKCMDMLENIGIEYGNIIEVVPNSRAKKRWGQCCKVPGGFSININVALLDERNKEEGLINTILHELLHSCKDCMNHGNKWKRLAEKIRNTYGYDVKRTSSAADKGVIENTMGIEYKYAVQCGSCMNVVRRTRRSDLIKFPEFFRCKCGGKFIRIR